VKATKAYGNCSKTGCGQYTEAFGADETDAQMLLNHEHGHDHKHVFHGVPKFKQVNMVEEVKHEKPRR
jgi:hypothetical protein